MSLALFIISALSAGSILVLSLVAHFSRRIQFWPPPDGKSWQHWTFKALFRGFLYPLLILTYLEFDLQTHPQRLFQYATGIAMLVIGFGLTFLITFNMGWRNAFGEKRGLNTDGWFAHSRNPIYAATWLGLTGWALIVPSPYVGPLLALWAALYLLAPFLEEPWLEEQYGDAYRIYKKSVPRFFFRF